MTLHQLPCHQLPCGDLCPAIPRPLPVFFVDITPQWQITFLFQDKVKLGVT